MSDRVAELRRLMAEAGGVKWDKDRGPLMLLPEEVVALIVATHNALPALLAVVAAARGVSETSGAWVGERVRRMEILDAALAALDGEGRPA